MRVSLTQEQYDKYLKTMQSVTKIKLELSEMRGYLDRPEPNTAAAIRRINDIEEIIRS